MSHATNYVLDPRSLKGKTSGMKDPFFIETFFHDNLVQNLNALKQYQHVKAPDQLSAPDENGRRSYILEYSAENTHTFQFLSDKTVRYTQYCAGIRINGKYVRNGAAPSAAKYVSFDWIIRTVRPTGWPTSRGRCCTALCATISTASTSARFVQSMATSRCSLR